jgi:hypothetical protein
MSVYKHVLDGMGTFGADAIGDAMGGSAGAAGLSACSHRFSTRIHGRICVTRR